MKRRNVPIKWKITSMTLGVVLVSIVIGMTVFLGLLLSNQRDDIGQRTMLTAQMTAQMELVQELDEPSAQEELQQLTERIRATQEDDYIVLLDMEGTRLTHPVPERIGTAFSGGDEEPAFYEHVYLSEARADSGTTVRAFVPVVDENRSQIGVVVVGNQYPPWYSMLGEMVHPLLIFLGFALAFGIWGSWQLANHIKSQTFQMEPDELARTLKERTATFHAIHEGVIAIDQNQTITIMNDAARRMLNIQGAAVGERIQDVIPDTRLPEVLDVDAPIMEQEFYVQGRAIFSNRIPISQDGRTIGAVAIFQDRTDMTRLARQLTGVQNYVDALRVQNHESSNKLHTIAGLIQLGRGESALDYIFQVTRENDHRFSRITSRIQDESIAGLLIGKMQRARELDMKLHMDDDMAFRTYPEGVDEHDLVVIIGNLLTNSMEAFPSEQTDCSIHFTMYEENDSLLIQISDNGAGMSEADKQHLFDKGWSTKSTEGRGLGMYLIHTILHRINGEIDVYSAPDEGTEMVLTIPMTREGSYDSAVSS
ncbi:ATP-binding protein [Alkalicoccus urumqiensis]|uniref:histidine kinase n=1 Tax=Alkalicoccus urumqiensis TaxID=1548213 RepID=A0A2P6MLT6_ALKUR|nr:sensor histidine kinase [Alkalicoccus urumqiensis]PRO67231.1 histidine kinase [Alkalicoccus urumqiensis]